MCSKVPAIAVAVWTATGVATPGVMAPVAGSTPNALRMAATLDCSAVERPDQIPGVLEVMGSDVRGAAGVERAASACCA